MSLYKSMSSEKTITKLNHKFNIPFELDDFIQ